MAEKTFILKPAPADPAHSRDTAVRLCSFPPGKRGASGRRFLHPDGETVVASDAGERRWWMHMIRSGDVLEVKSAKGETWTGPAPLDRGSENVPEFKEVKKKGGK